MDKKYKKIKYRSIKKNCSKDYLYEGDEEAPNNAFEDFYNAFETKYAPQYANLIKARFCLRRVGLKQKKLLCLLYAHFSSRNETNLYENRQNHALASHFTIGIDDKRVDRRFLLNAIALSNSGTLDPDASDFAKHLMTYNIEILMTTTPKIIFTDSILQQTHGEEEYFFPLCPTMVARFTKAEDVVDRNVRIISEDEYARFIDLYVRSQYAWKMYASNKQVLEDIKEKYVFVCVSIPIEF